MRCMVLRLAFSLFVLSLICSLTIPSYAQRYTWDADIPLLQDSALMDNPWSGSFNAPQVSKMDLDEDGFSDLVLFDRTSNKVSTFLYSSASGEYKYEPSYEALFPSDITGWMLLRDFDCDGEKDLFANSQLGMKVYRNARTQTGDLSWLLVADPLLTTGSSGDINLQVNVTDIPAIDDLDNDGDLDILVFDFASGETIRHHRNFSVENSGACGLDFTRETDRWGDFYECDCDIFSFGTPCSPSRTTNRLLHVSGKAMTTLDMDGDGDKELLMGQEDCEPLYYLENVGTPPGCVDDFL